MTVIVPPPPEGTYPPGSGRAKGTLFAVIALVFVVVMVIFFPAARIFLAFSIAIGIVFAVVIHFVNQRPVALPDEANKTPLGLNEPPSDQWYRSSSSGDPDKSS